MATIALVIFAAMLILALFATLPSIKKAPALLYIERNPRRPRRRTH
ncbi:hypothetical protein [Candidatus Viridilinea mediisalina]|nr:hypothetical protein [Candidatus Viridilinea mediisalina]